MTDVICSIKKYYLCKSKIQNGMNNSIYVKLSKSQIDKIGNTMVYLSKNIKRLSKTKLLKLLYILDEISIKSSGIPFLNLQYKVWKYGPVSAELFIDLSQKNDLGKLKDFIKKDKEGHIHANADFVDDEFSDSDIDLMDKVISKYGKLSANDLIDFTHRPDGLWYETAKKNNVLTLLQNEETNNTDFVIDMRSLVSDDPIKSRIYDDYVELFG